MFKLFLSILSQYYQTQDNILRQRSRNLDLPSIYSGEVSALGTALVGKFQDPLAAWQAVEEAKELNLKISGGETDYAHLAADLLEINYDVADYLDKAHMLGIPIAELGASLTENNFCP